MVITLITILTSLPLFYKGLDGHDIAFHLMRIEDITQELRNGQFPVYVSSAWMGGYGYPTSVFYGYVLLYFPAMLRLFGVNVNSAYKIDITILQRCGKNFDIEYRNYNSKVGKVKAPIINYKGYKIYDENGVVIPIEDSDTCLVQFEVPSNYTGIIYIRYIEPWYWKVALYILLSCIFAICCIGLNERRITQRTDNKH